MYIPVVIAMSASQNVVGAISGGGLAIIAGLAATDAKLVPYGAMTATFYTGLGCLLCPSVLYSVVRLFLA